MPRLNSIVRRRQERCGLTNACISGRVAAERFILSTSHEAHMSLRKLFSRRKRPMFMAVGRQDAEMQQAHASAASTLPIFTSHVLRPGEHMCCAKLRFRDPELSHQMGEDRFLFLWLNSVTYDPKDQVFSGTFFELPKELLKWHRVGESLTFAPDEIFDWFVKRERKARRRVHHAGRAVTAARKRARQLRPLRWNIHLVTSASVVTIPGAPGAPPGQTPPTPSLQRTRYVGRCAPSSASR